MDLEVARKALSKRSKFSPKRVAFFVVAGLCLVAGILLRSGQYFAQPEVEPKAPVAVSPSPPPVATTSAEEATESRPGATPTRAGHCDSADRKCGTDRQSSGSA